MPLQLAGLAALHSAAFRANPACFDPEHRDEIEQGLATPGSAVAAALLQRETRRNRPACCSRSGRRSCSPSGLSPRGGVRLRCRRSPLWRGRSGSGACRWSSPPGKPGPKGTNRRHRLGSPSASPLAISGTAVLNSPLSIAGAAAPGPRHPRERIRPGSSGAERHRPHRLACRCRAWVGRVRDDRARRNRRQRRLDRRWQGELKCRSQPRGGEMLMRPPRRQRVARREERRRFWTSNAADLSSEDAAIRSTRVW